MGELRVLQKISNHEFEVELWIMRDAENQNKWNYQNLENHYLTFVGRPILIAYVNGKIGDGHNARKKIESNVKILSFLKKSITAGVCPG